MPVQEQEMQQLTAMVWESILSLPVEPRAGEPNSGPSMMSACVHITGAWQGAVSISCDADLAARAAGIMFALDAASTGKSDVQDALGELANMIGGNVKALLPEPCQLSLPSVVDGAEYSVRIPRSRVVTRVAMSCEGSPLDVVLIEKETPLQ
ncbi:MAG TPA: chemotaxis protein CheX [Tepidisphaeraceae bacterium]